MAAVELILLQRVDKLGQMGEVVRVKPGYARNYLLPQKIAHRGPPRPTAILFERPARCSWRRRTCAAARRPSAWPSGSAR